jgi:hypothetical protein
MVKRTRKGRRSTPVFAAGLTAASAMAERVRNRYIVKGRLKVRKSDVAVAAGLGALSYAAYKWRRQRKQ